MFGWTCSSLLCGLLHTESGVDIIDETVEAGLEILIVVTNDNDCCYCYLDTTTHLSFHNTIQFLQNKKVHQKLEYISKAVLVRFSFLTLYIMGGWIQLSSLGPGSSTISRSILFQISPLKYGLLKPQKLNFGNKDPNISKCTEQK